ncbi:hypothetical protein L21SP3_01150 [Sedimentisphaera cyanobacteriorum]|uniref:DUF4435 domain-containing protein n=1 Tax=Sedimentisphaera cyanobacteriorum TaxID=1940790 RepID=A0A1Q2HQ20_9BACT|nr:DUF3226 domain-containing protein [Sedimentisphaera cyanobacteriorum]AQQ09346.1 hypothetical protein L21SP3_01150 [Sedimentisphaera cyanobacteriorum]
MPSIELEKTESEIVFIVEGKDDEIFLNSFIKKRITEDDSFQIVQLKGKKNLKQTLKDVSKIPGFRKVRRLAVIIDADNSCENTFKSIKNALSHTGFPKPEKLGEFTSDSERKLSAAAYIMPNCCGEGELEDLLLSSIEDTQALNCIDSFWNCIGKERKTSKGSAQIYLASREKFTSGIGAGVQRKYFILKSNKFSKLQTLLKQAFL